MKPFRPPPPPFDDQERALRALEWAEKARAAAVTAAQLLAPIDGSVFEHLMADDVATRAAESVELIKRRIVVTAQEGAKVE